MLCRRTPPHARRTPHHTPCLLLLLLLLSSLSLVPAEVSSGRLGADHDAYAEQQNRNLPVRLYPIYRLHPVDAFDRSVVCAVNDGSTFCSDSSNRIRFVDRTTTTTAPQPNEFWYQPNRGPAKLQGAFWFQDQPLGQSLLVSFAESRLGNGVATGVLGDNGVEDDFAMVLRVRSDHTWAFSGTGPEPFPASSFLNDQFDVLYKFDLTGGSLEAPTNFQIVAEGRLGWNCIRLGVWKQLWYLFSQFSMNLLTDPSDPTVQHYSNSAIWQRRTSFLFGLITPPGAGYQYNAVQIVDGSGTPLQPAYNEFLAYVEAEYGNRIFFYGLKEDRLEDYESCWRPWWG